VEVVALGAGDDTAQRNDGVRPDDGVQRGDEATDALTLTRGIS
jgi:hypothetical protein